MSIILPGHYGNDKLIITPNNKIGRCNRNTIIDNGNACCCFLPASADPYNPEISYGLLDIVSYTIGTVPYLWISKQGNNLNHTPYWGSAYWDGYFACGGNPYGMGIYEMPKNFIMSIRISKKEYEYNICSSPTRQGVWEKELNLNFRICLNLNGCHYSKSFNVTDGDQVRGYSRYLDPCFGMECTLNIDNSSQFLTIPFFSVGFDNFYDANYNFVGMIRTYGHLKYYPTVTSSGGTYVCANLYSNSSTFDTMQWWSTSTSEAAAPLIVCGDSYKYHTYYSDTTYQSDGYTYGIINDDVYVFSWVPASCGDCYLWNPDTSYAIGACVAWNGKFYRSCEPNNLNHEPEDDASNICETGYYWRLA